MNDCYEKRSGQAIVGAAPVVALPRCSMEKQEIAVPSTLFPNLTNKNACTTLSISGYKPPTLTTTRKWRKMARYGTNTTRKTMPLRFSNLPCARCPRRSRELYDNEKNATECNTMQQIFKKSSAGRALTSPGTPTHPVITLKAIPYPGSTHFNCWRCRLRYEKFRAQ